VEGWHGTLVKAHYYLLLSITEVALFSSSML